MSRPKAEPSTLSSRTYPYFGSDIEHSVSEDRYLYLIDHATGKRRLDFRTSRVRGSPAFHENLVFVSDESGAVRAVDCDHFLILWSLVAVAALVIGGWIGYVNLGPARFLPPPSSDVSAAPVGGDWPMFQRDPAHAAFVAEESATPVGRLKWRFEINAPIFSSPAVVGGQVYLSTGDKRYLSSDTTATTS